MFALMIAAIWLTCGIIALVLRDTKVMDLAHDITVCAGIGYILTAS